jgi:SAM-dependent methyltransferase
MGTNKNIDAVYYRDGVSQPTAMAVLVNARRSMFELFLRELRPSETTTILDIGVSDEENEGANFLEKSYPFRRNLTCAGIGDGEAVRKAYPEVRYRRITPNEPLPFSDGEFDIACSNAVLEHVGGREQRQRFIREHLRVARSVFITVPNRWFPIEHHTRLPLLHYWPAMFRRILASTRYAYWTESARLEFLDAHTILREWPAERKPRVVTTGLPLGPLSSNLAIIWNAGA